MSRYYDTDEEQEADKLGHKDAQRNRKDYDHDKYSDEPNDVAYWQGRKDEERKIQIEEEERQMEIDREQREFERQKREEANQREREEDSDQQSVSDFDALMENERHDMESQDEDLANHYRGLPDDTQSEDDERPYSEEDLFRDILRDEREDNE
jgi:hypothetical protein